MSVSILNGDCHDVLASLAPGSIHLTVTSPPYDAIRDYHGKPSFDYRKLASQIYDATADGGVCCIVIQDQTKDFAKSVTSFRLACAFVDAGWKLFETCLYYRHGTPGNWWSQRWRVDHEYIFQFFRGKRPRQFDKSQLLVRARNPGESFANQGTRDTAGNIRKSKSPGVVSDMKCRGTVWEYAKAASEGNKTKLRHPATFPDKLAADLIAAFSLPGDIVLDPFAGSGTTLVMANQMGRDAIGIEIAPAYVDLIRERLGLFAA